MINFESTLFNFINRSTIPRKKKKRKKERKKRTKIITLKTSSQLFDELLHKFQFSFRKQPDFHPLPLICHSCNGRLISNLISGNRYVSLE